MVTIIEASTGAGFTIGPFVGSLLFSLGGFSFPFLAVGVIFALLVSAFKYWVPDVQNYERISRPEVREFGYCDLLASRRFCFLLAGIVLNITGLSFLEPILEPFMRETYGVEVDMVGLIFFMIGIGYVLSCSVIMKLQNCFNMRTIIHTGTLIMAIALFLAGSSRQIGVPTSLELTVSACIMVGVACGELVVIASELIHTASYSSGASWSDCSDLVAGVQSIALAFGYTLGPLVGNFLYHKYGFSWACSMMSITMITYAACHVLVCDIFYSSKNHNS